MLLIALATFDPRDPAPFFKAGVEGPARNFIGPFGAFLAEMLIPQLFGLAALLLPIVLGLARLEALLVPADRGPLHEGGRQPASCCSRSPALLALAVGTVSFEGEPVRAGGAVGELVAGLLVGGLQPHRRLHRGRHRPLRRAHPRRRSSRSPRSSAATGGRARRAPAGAADRVGPLPREPAQGEDAPRGHPQAHRRRGTEAGGLPRIRQREGRPTSRRARPTLRRTTDDPTTCRCTPRPPRAAAPRAEGAALRGARRRRRRTRRRGRAPAAAARRRRGRPRRRRGRRRGARQLHPAPDHDPRRAEGRVARSTTTACSRRAASCRRSAASSA